MCTKLERYLKHIGSGEARNNVNHVILWNFVNETNRWPQNPSRHLHEAQKNCGDAVAHKKVEITDMHHLSCRAQFHTRVSLHTIGKVQKRWHEGFETFQDYSLLGGYLTGLDLILFELTLQVLDRLKL